MIALRLVQVGFLSVLLLGSLFAQNKDVAPRALSYGTIAARPSAATAGANTVYVETDGSSSCDVSTGGGSTQVLVVSNGSSWVAPNCGSVTGITLAGTSSQITATGTCTVTTSGTCTFSLPSSLVLPGTINKLTLTAPATGATVTIADGKTITVNRTLTFTGTDGIVVTFPASSATMATLGLTNTFTGRQDATGAASTAAFKTGTSLPGTCTVGDEYFKSDATAGQNLYGCTATDTWTLQAGGGGGTGNAGAKVTTTFSATPTFTCPSSTAGTIVQFNLSTSLTANITSSTLSGCTGSSSLSSILTFVFVQDGTGSRTVAMPTGFSQACQVSPIASSTTNMAFSWDGTTASLISCSTTGNSVGGETAAPGTPPSGYQFPWFDSTGHLPRWKNPSGTIFQGSKEGTSGQLRVAGGANAPDTFITPGTGVATALTAGVSGTGSICLDTGSSCASGGGTPWINRMISTTIGGGGGDTALDSQSISSLAAGACLTGRGFLEETTVNTNPTINLNFGATTVLIRSGASSSFGFLFTVCNVAGSQTSQVIYGSYANNGAGTVLWNSGAGTTGSNDTTGANTLSISANGAGNVFRLSWRVD